jgi:hypothetical protein
MQAAIAQNFQQMPTPKTLRPSAGQSAKTKCLPLKPATTKDLTAGRQAEKKPHTPTHAENAPVRIEERLTKTEYIRQQSRTMHLMQFVETVSLLHPEQSTFSNHFAIYDCVKAALEAERANLFFKLTAAFTLLNKRYRTEVRAGVFRTEESDFIAALRLIGGIKTTFHPPHNISNETLFTAQHWLENHCQKRTFTAMDVSAATACCVQIAQKIIKELLRNDFIRLVSRQGGGEWKYALV